MKGQYLTVEHLFYFAIGIAMVVLVYYTFSSMGETYNKSIIDIEAGKIGNLARNEIIGAFSATSMYGGTLEKDVAIPQKISGHSYRFYVSGNNLQLSIPEIGKDFLFPLSNVTVSGVSSSESQSMHIYSSMNSVTIT